MGEQFAYVQVKVIIISNEVKRESKLNFIDLAGSESSKKSQTAKNNVLLKEGSNINKSLLSLGNVINQLSELCQSLDRKEKLDSRKKVTRHISFRNSKLTRILKESFCGNHMTIMISCINQEMKNYDETIQTLNYAQRVMQIENTV